MQENLKTTHYNNGDTIPNVTDTATWNHLTSGAYCNYDNNNSYVATYGRLYNWYVINDNRNVCPTDWHVPDDSEWTTLVNYLGGENVAGGKMKEVGTSHWGTSTGATNSSGFTALPAGERVVGIDQYSFVAIGAEVLFWSFEEPECPGLDMDTNGVYRNTLSEKFGESIRCLKDASTGLNNKIKDDQIAIFPNPTKGHITLSIETSQNRESIVEIYNLLGTQVFSKTFQNTTSVSIDLTDNSAGIYVVRAFVDGELLNKKICIE